jgi:transposase
MKIIILTQKNRLKLSSKKLEIIKQLSYYSKKEFEPISVDKNNYLSIDMGLDNFATCFNSNNGCVSHPPRLKLNDLVA